MIFVVHILRKFDIDNLYICPPYLYTVATLPWEIQKVILNSIIHAHFRLFMLSQKKMLPPYPPHLKNVTTLPCKM